MILLLVVLFIVAVLTGILTVYFINDMCHDWLGFFSCLSCLVAAAVFIILSVLFVTASDESKFWNKKFDTNYTADEWLFNSSVIKGEKLEIKDSKIHLEID